MYCEIFWLVSHLFCSAPGEPTAAPFNIEPTTSSPTSATSLTVRASPYALFYTLEEDETVPSTAELAQLTEVTRGYLEEFMIEFYSMTSLTNLDDFLTFMIRHSFTVGEPVQVDYRSTGLFNPDTIFLPGTRQLDELIASAFMGEDLEVYLARVRSLPDDNIFSTTESIVQGVPDTPDPREDGMTRAGSSATYTAGLASAAAGIVVLAAGLVLLRRNREGEEEGFGESNDTKADGNATVAGETCASSLDGSSSMNWRTKNLRYIVDEDNDDNDGADLDDDDFQDEPLDDEPLDNDLNDIRRHSASARSGAR